MTEETAKRVAKVLSRTALQLIAKQERRTLTSAAKHVAKAYRHEGEWQQELKALVRVANEKRGIAGEVYVADPQWSASITTIVDMFMADPKQADRFASDLADPAFKKALNDYLRVKWYDNIPAQRPRTRGFSVFAKRDLNAV